MLTSIYNTYSTKMYKGSYIKQFRGKVEHHHLRSLAPYSIIRQFLEAPFCTYTSLACACDVLILFFIVLFNTIRLLLTCSMHMNCV